MKRVSLIIPVYNAAKYLPQMAESLLGQDWENLQILFSDDGSTDESVQILTRLAERDRRITVVIEENGGVSAARNRALALADGDYIGFTDADDILKPDYVRRLAEALEQTGADMACCGFDRIYAASGKQDYLPTGHSEPETVDRNGMARLLLRPDGYTTVVWNKLFRREALTGADGKLMRFDESLHIVEDGEYIFRSGVKQTVFFPDRLYCYYVRNSGAMYGKLTDRKLTELAARKKIVELTDSLSPDVQALAKMKYQKGVRDLMFHSVIAGDGDAVKHLRSELRVYRDELFRSPALTKKEKIKYHIYGPIIQLNLRHVGAFLMNQFGGH